MQDRTEAAAHLSRLLFVSLACGMAMFFITTFGATPLLTGAKGHFIEYVIRLNVLI